MYIDASKFYVGIAMFISNMGSKHLQNDMTSFHNYVLQLPLVKKVVLFSTCYVYTRDVIVSMILVVMITLLIDMLLNENSRCCILPPSVKKHFLYNKETTP